MTIPPSQNPHSSSHYQPQKKKQKLSTAAEGTTEGTTEETTEATDVETAEHEGSSERSPTPSTTEEDMPEDMPPLEGEEKPELSTADRRMMQKIAQVQKMNTDELGEVTEKPPTEKAGLLDAFVSQTEPELLLAISGKEIPEEGKNFADLMEDPAADTLLLTRSTDGRRYKITAAAVAREWRVTTDQLSKLATDTSHLRPAEVAQQLAAQDYSVRSVKVNLFTYLHPQNR